MCGGPYETTAGFADKYESDFDKAKALLKEGGYDGTPVVLMHSTDLYVLTNMAPVAKSLMERAGMKVDMQSMDWQTLVSRRAKREPPAQGGWNLLITSTSGADALDPLTYSFIGATCDKAWFGWPCDAEITKLRDAFTNETDEARRKEIVEKPFSSAPPRTRPTPSSASTTTPWRCGRISAAPSYRRSRCSGTSRRSDAKSLTL